jgi:hypothetical protein
LISRIRELIEPYDVVGLTKEPGRAWFPVDAGDLYRAAPKLAAEKKEIDQLLVRCGFAPTPIENGQSS